MKILNLIIPFWFVSSLLAIGTLHFNDVQSKNLPVENGPGETIKIGLLIPDKKSLSAKQGAELAIRNANEKGGLNGKHFQLVLRSMEGPWGAGSRQAVNMVFEDEVLAILGSHDGRNAHMVEQVSAKSRFIFLSAWSTDPTLTQAFVPWFFNCVPNDLQQADALIKEIFIKRNLNKIALVSDSDYDAKMALQNFAKKVRSTGKPEPVQFLYNIGSKNFNELIGLLDKANADAIVLFGQPLASLKIIQEIRQRKMSQTIFGSLSVSNESAEYIQKLSELGNVVLISSGQFFNARGLAFEKEFQKSYSCKPDAIAAYAFDGMSMIINSIMEAGLDHDKILKALTKINYKGITGQIQFDERGNRKGTTGLMIIRDGKPVSISKD